MPAKTKATPTRIKPHEIDRHTVALVTLGEAVEAQRDAHVHFKDRIGTLGTQVAEAEAALERTKQETEADLAKAKASIDERRRKELNPLQEKHRRVSGLLDELLGRLARVRDTLA